MTITSLQCRLTRVFKMHICTREAGGQNSKRLKLPKRLATCRMNQQRDAQLAINPSNVVPTYR